MRSLALAAFAALALCGCRQQSIVGTWEQSGLVGRRVTFADDGTFSVTGNGMAAAVSLVGTYTIDKNRFTLKGLKTKSNIPFAPIAEAEMPGGQDVQGTFTFKNDKTLTLQGTMILDGSYTRAAE